MPPLHVRDKGQQQDVGQWQPDGTKLAVTRSDGVENAPGDVQVRYGVAEQQECAVADTIGKRHESQRQSGPGDEYGLVAYGFRTVSVLHRWIALLL